MDLVRQRAPRGDTVPVDGGALRPRWARGVPPRDRDHRSPAWPAPRLHGRGRRRRARCHRRRHPLVHPLPGLLQQFRLSRRRAAGDARVPRPRCRDPRRARAVAVPLEGRCEGAPAPDPRRRGPGGGRLRLARARDQQRLLARPPAGPDLARRVCAHRGGGALPEHARHRRSVRAGAPTRAAPGPGVRRRGGRASRPRPRPRQPRCRSHDARRDRDRIGRRRHRRLRDDPIRRAGATHRRRRRGPGVTPHGGARPRIPGRDRHHRPRPPVDLREPRHGTRSRLVAGDRRRPAARDARLPGGSGTGGRILRRGHRHRAPGADRPTRCASRPPTGPAR